MPWLNWSLKLHIRLRTISFLIFTHNIHVFVQWMPYSFMWLYLIKCVFTCSICVGQTQKAFWVFLLFLESFLFLQKMSKFQKTVLPSSGDSVAGWSSRMSVQSHVLVTCPHRFFSWLTSGSMPSHEKYLEYFSKFGFLMFLATKSNEFFAGGRSSRERA